jgi:hypothetical protein
VVAAAGDEELGASVVVPAKAGTQRRRFSINDAGLPLSRERRRNVDARRVNLYGVVPAKAGTQ